MDLLKQITLIFSLYYFGEILSYFSPFPIPGSVIGMLFLTILLFFGLIKENQIKEKTNFLFKYMPIIFLPPAVNLLHYLEFLKASWWKLLIVIGVSSFLTFAVTGLIVEFTLKIFSSKKLLGREGGRMDD